MSEREGEREKGRREGEEKGRKEGKREKDMNKMDIGKNVSRRQALCCALVDFPQAGVKWAEETTLSEKPGQEPSRLHQQLGPPTRECGQKQDRCVSTKGRGALMPGKGLACFWEQWGAAESF